tara:strand:+ start:2287 stop:2433 length:147 start_codon:yes stop_codon:yes gene_type:complete
MALNYGFQYLNNPIFRAGKHGQIVVILNKEYAVKVPWRSLRGALSSGS